MSAAVLQGTPATTLDTDIWIELPERQYPVILEIVQQLGGKVLARTVVALKDDSIVNFLYRIDGLKSFADEIKQARRIRWNGMIVPVLPLAKIIKSKEFVARPKDLAHLPLLKQTLKFQRPRPTAG